MIIIIYIDTIERSAAKRRHDVLSNILLIILFENSLQEESIRTWRPGEIELYISGAHASFVPVHRLRSLRIVWDILHNICHHNIQKCFIFRFSGWTDRRCECICSCRRCWRWPSPPRCATLQPIRAPTRSSPILVADTLSRRLLILLDAMWTTTRTRTRGNARAKITPTTRVA